MRVLAFLASVLAVWPQPAFFEHGSEVRYLGELRIQICLLGGNERIIHDAVDRSLDLLRDGYEELNPMEYTEGVTITELRITQITAPEGSYSLNVTDRIDVSGDIVGIIYALTTLSQLFYTDTQGRYYSPLAPLSILDRPIFSWRGVNIDVSRHWLPVSVLEKVIDGMSWNKLNRLHLHTTDSQAWPLDVPSLPGLVKGAYSGEQVYSVADLESIQQYARERGVEVVVEIDLPGHTASIHDGYPDLITGYNVQARPFADSTYGSPEVATKDWSAYCNEPPCGQLKLGVPEVHAFLDKLLDDLLPRSKSNWFHAGGDEVNKNVYLLQEGLATNDSAVLRPLLQQFVSTVHEKIREHGKIPIAWEEMITTWNLNLPLDVLIQTWIDADSIKKVTSKGYKVIAGSSSNTYLDCGKGQWIDFTVQAVPYQSSQGFVDYCSPFKNWKRIYTYDPLYNLTSTEAALVQGFEVHAWAEQIDEHNIEQVLWPRAAAAAEVAWNGTLSTAASPIDGRLLPNSARSLEDAGARLSIWRERLIKRGIHAEPIHPTWCTRHPGQCSL